MERVEKFVDFVLDYFEIKGARHSKFAEII